jgi:hypothetical protein
MPRFFTCLPPPTSCFSLKQRRLLPQPLTLTQKNRGKSSGRKLKSLLKPPCPFAESKRSSAASCRHRNCSIAAPGSRGSGERRLPACCIRPLRRMSSFASLMCARNRFAAGCRELQASSLLSPESPFLFVILPQFPSGISLGVRIGTELNSPARSQKVRKTCAMSRID